MILLNKLEITLVKKFTQILF